MSYFIKILASHLNSYYKGSLSKCLSIKERANLYTPRMNCLQIYTIFIILQTKADVSPITESTGADSNDVSDMLPSQAGLIVLLSTSVGKNCTTNAVVLLDTPPWKMKVCQNVQLTHSIYNNTTS